jgi:hypothetical protein
LRLQLGGDRISRARLQIALPHAEFLTPVDRIGCSLAAELPVPAPVSSRSVQPSPFLSGSASTSSLSRPAQAFTRVTACWVAHPLFVGFIAGLRHSSTNNLLAWVLLPVAICPVRAH